MKRKKKSLERKIKKLFYTLTKINLFSKCSSVFFNVIRFRFEFWLCILITAIYGKKNFFVIKTNWLRKTNCSTKSFWSFFKTWTQNEIQFVSCWFVRWSWKMFWRNITKKKSNIWNLHLQNELKSNIWSIWSKCFVYLRKSLAEHVVSRFTKFFRNMINCLII